MNNLKIGRYIRYALLGLDIPVFPIGQDGSNNGENFPPPFISYRRGAFNEDSDKDHIYEGYVPVNIDIVATTYDQLIDIASQVQDALHQAPTLWNTQQPPFYISDQSLSFGEEQMDDTLTVYVTEITANIETTNI